MRHLLILWTVLGCTYLAFQAWHLPLRGPLSETEARAQLSALLSQVDGRDSLPEQALEFFLQDDGEPFYMVHLDTFAEQEDVDQVQANLRDLVLPHMLRRGSYPMFSWDSLAVFENGQVRPEQQFDRLTIVRYRSRRDLLAILAEPNVRQGAAYRWEMLERSLAAPSARGPALNLEAFLPTLLLLIGALVTLRTVANRARLSHA